jgi:hypothetical protein
MSKKKPGAALPLRSGLQIKHPRSDQEDALLMKHFTPLALSFEQVRLASP